MSIETPNKPDPQGVDRLLNDELAQIKIPPRPAVMGAIEREMRSPAPNYGALEKVISLDVSISASLLKIANSAFFGHRGTVRSVKEALQVLGLNTVGTAIAGISLRKAFAHVPNLERFWDSSARIAQLSGWLAIQLKSGSRPVRPEEAYTFGLFRDCGIAVLMSFFSCYFDVLKIANAETERPFTAVEQEQLDVDHGMIGAMLVKEWQLPIEYQAAVELHHDLDAIRGLNSHQVPDLSRHFIAITQLAEFLFQQLSGLNKTCEWPKLGDACLAVLGLSEQDVQDLLTQGRGAGVHTHPVV